MRIAVSGSTGFIGSALCNSLRSQGHLVLPMVRGERNQARAGSIFWNPASGEIDADALGATEAVIHLAGESIAAGRWTEEKKARILESRVQGTHLIATTMANRTEGPRILISGSAIGYYGNRGDEFLDEQSAPGKGFLADVCKQWEAATSPAQQAGIRVVRGRIGVVLGIGGGALAKMLPLFKTGLGGPIGSGKQYWSWIVLNDLVRAISFLLSTEISGSVNLVAPYSVTNKEFTEQLARNLNKPAFLPAPDFALRLALGQMADEMLLSSQRVRPVALETAGFHCEQPNLDSALRSIL
jgi:uncharacterized protein (TIGR01777 family)